MKAIDYSLCLVTDRSLMSTKTLEEAVEAAIQGGATLIQLREKDAPIKEMYDIALNIKKITDRHNIPLIINDRADIALAVNASGIHVGQSDLPAYAAKEIIPDNMILGVSVSNVPEAVKAQNDGADYIGVGAMFTTGTKTDAKAVSKEELIAIRNAVTIPIVIIGGLNRENISEFSGTGIDGLAIVSAIIAEKDIKFATEEILDIFFA